MTKSTTAAQADAPKNTRRGASGFEPTLVHAYRRQPHMVVGPDGRTMVEQAVQVVFEGEKVEFKSNERGHIVGLVSKEATFKRLTREIPEAYIPYGGGDNVPAPSARPLAAEHANEQRPDGEFVLESTDGEGKKQYKVLDGLGDAELREFGAECGLQPEQLPDVLTGETLARAIYQLLTTA